MRNDPIGVLGAFLLLTIMTALFWLIIPIGAFVWLLTLEATRRRPASLGAYLGWLTNNIVFVLVRGPFRLSFPDSPVKWIPASERSGVTNRIRFSDLF